MILHKNNNCNNCNKCHKCHKEKFGPRGPTGLQGPQGPQGSPGDQGYFYGRGTIAYNGLGNVFTNLLLQITSNIDNVSDILVLTCQKIGTGTTPVNATISWQEIY